MAGLLGKIIGFFVMMVIGVVISILNVLGYRTYHKVPLGVRTAYPPKKYNLYNFILTMGGFGIGLLAYATLELLRTLLLLGNIRFFETISRALTNGLLILSVIGAGAFAAYNLHVIKQVEEGKTKINNVEWINFAVIGVAAGVLFGSILEVVDTLVPGPFLDYVVQITAIIGCIFLFINSSIGIDLFNKIKGDSNGKITHSDPFFGACIAGIIIGILGAITLVVLMFFGL